MGFVRKSNASFFLFINAFLWGTSYIWSKMLLRYLPRFSILFICSLGGLISTLVLFFPSLKTIKRSDVLPSIIISGFSIVSNTFSMFALQYTGSSNAAFIVQMSVVITPLIMAVLERKKPGRKITASAVIAVSGLFLLICDFDSFIFNMGDLFALGNALFFSLYLVGQNLYSSKVETVHFTFIYYAANTAAFLFLSLILERYYIDLGRLDTPDFGLLASASVLVSVITVLLQSAAIKHVRPEKATIIYTFEPVTALVLGHILLDETMSGLKPIIGCMLILASVLCSNFRPKVRDKGLESRGRPTPVAD